MRACSATVPSRVPASLPRMRSPRVSRPSHYLSSHCVQRNSAYMPAAHTTPSRPPRSRGVDRGSAGPADGVIGFDNRWAGFCRLGLLAFGIQPKAPVGQRQSTGAVQML